MKLTRWAFPTFVLTLAMSIPAGLAYAQQAPPPTTQAPSPKADPVAEAARRAREQKKAEAKPAHVWTNDNLPAQPGEVSVVGVETPTAPAGTDTQAGAPAQSGAANPAKIKELQDRVAALASDLDLAQRKYTLDSDMFYGKTNYQGDSEGKASLDGEAASVKQKQQQLDDAKAQLAALQGKLTPPPAKKE